MFEIGRPIKNPNKNTEMYVNIITVDSGQKYCFRIMPIATLNGGNSSCKGELVTYAAALTVVTGI